MSILINLSFPLGMTWYLSHGESVREGVLVGGLVEGGVEGWEGE